MRNLLIAAATIMALSAAPAFAAGGGGGGGTDNPATGAVRLSSYARWNGETWREASREAAANRFATLQQRPGYLDAPEHLGGSGSGR
jgi:hypothetical protein